MVQGYGKFWVETGFLMRMLLQEVRWEKGGLERRGTWPPRKHLGQDRVVRGMWSEEEEGLHWSPEPGTWGGKARPGKC